MKRLLLLLALAALPGCDVAVAAYLMSQQDDSSSDDGPPAPLPSPGFPNGVFKAYVSQIADAAAADQARLDLITDLAATGEPNLAAWTELGVFTVTEVFNPDNAITFNTILIVASSTLNYDLDCVEILDANNQVVDHASGTTYSNLVNFPDEILGPPDGSVAVTNAAGSERAFIFTIYPSFVDQFRINGHPPAAPAPGDIIAEGGYSSLLAERPGGMAIDANGLVHLTLSVGDTVRLARYDLAASINLPVDSVEISNDLFPTGSHSVALNSAGVIFTAASIGAGTIQVRRFETDLTAGNLAGFSSGLNNDRVEHNSIAVDGAGNIVVVGGMSSVLSGRNHWRVKLPNSVSGTPIWQSNPSTSLDSSSNTYWHAVTIGANDDVFMAGDLFSGVLLGGTTQLYTGQFTTGGVATWDDSFAPGEQAADLGHAIQLDSAGNMYIGGSVGKASGGKDAVIVRYTPGGTSVDSAEFIGAGGADDEILDVAVDTDGSIYVVGYEGVAGQGENWFVRKLTYDDVGDDFVPVWLRTHNGSANGNDRAVSVAIFGNQLVVAGFETVSGLTKLKVRVYEK